MENRIEIPIGNKKLVAFINDWKDDLPKEIFVSLFDSNGLVVQDICMVREHYHYNKNQGAFEIDDSFIDCKVWADSDNEDYTDEFVIGVYEEDE
jgi:hypothetical protein